MRHARQNERGDAFLNPMPSFWIYVFHKADGDDDTLAAYCYGNAIRRQAESGKFEYAFSGLSDANPRTRTRPFATIKYDLKNIVVGHFSHSPEVEAETAKAVCNYHVHRQGISPRPRLVQQKEGENVQPLCVG